MRIDPARSVESDPWIAPLEAATRLRAGIDEGRSAHDPDVAASLIELLASAIDGFAAVLHPDGAVVAMTTATLRQTGMEPADVVGRRLWRIPVWASPSDVDVVREIVEGAAQGRTVSRRVEVAPQHGAPVRSLSLSARPARATDGRVAFVVAHTSRGVPAPSRPQEHAADVARHLQELMELRERLVADLVHDVRAPLLSVAARAARLSTAGDESVRQEAREMRASALSTLAQLDELRDLGGLHHRRTQLRLSSCDLVSLLRSVVRQFEPVAAQRECELRLEAPRALTVRCDEHKVSVIFGNVLANALQHSPRAGAIRLTLAADRDMARLEVADSGPGIPEGDMMRVFERRWRGTRARRAEGNGLGLAIVREFVELHGGTSAAGDAPEGGALIAIELPMNPVGGTEVTATLESAGASRLSTAAVVADLERRLGRDAAEAAKRTSPADE